MTRLTGRFDGRAVVLDNPQGVALPPETPVEVFVVAVPDEAVPDNTVTQTPSAEERQQALEEFRHANEAFWSRQSATTNPPAKRWTRDELYDETV